MLKTINVIGGGLAGCEAAWQLAGFGFQVNLFEMRPEHSSPAHCTGGLAELVCSNSLHSSAPTTAPGLLKEEMQLLNSLIIKTAFETSVPAGGALAVDRLAFSGKIEDSLSKLPQVKVFRQKINSLSEFSLPAVLASGPLSEGPLFSEISQITGDSNLYFHDAVAPLVAGESIDFAKSFWAGRYEQDADYLNLPMNHKEYDRFYQALINAESYPRREFEKSIFFEGCLPVEVIAGRGRETLCFGPLKPVGLTSDKSVKAIVQLRKEDSTNQAFNLVGFQTNLLIPEQKRIFRLIPGLENAEFLRFGKMHRNSYFNSPQILNQLEFIAIPGLFLSGQLTGVEGYCESASMGLAAAHYLYQKEKNVSIPFPPESSIGSLINHLSLKQKFFNPMNINYSLYPPLEGKVRLKSEKKELIRQRALASIKLYRQRLELV
ncbi:MAG: methylenetetrahydrofolate--tRNA-(uracil(54)-C(5))-methyltransferase (FADH(2)-oxidizing) TrmFO [Candidatus Wallbacteria bacterium]|nr:methylenetetrahydrofolate--tRNA-(uracil(54)-C(5))-methyltransferase (FADH(2)-oxidizing) TrmFO [Candidatus Wallbacteria bacterium]